MKQAYACFFDENYVNIYQMEKDKRKDEATVITETVEMLKEKGAAETAMSEEELKKIAESIQLMKTLG